MNAKRLDALLCDLGHFDSRERAKAVIMSGNVYIDGKRADKPGMQTDPRASVEIRSFPKYVSRGGQKLEKALEYFAVSPKDRVCIDCGGGSGGFTDCLLQGGARLVYVVDVGYGQLAWGIRNDPRVVTMERTNIRHVTPEMLATLPDLAVIDVSFISLALVLPAVRGLLAEGGEVLCLIKPQFEAGRDKVGKKGVVRHPETHISVLDAFLDNASQSGFTFIGVTHSPIKGPEGNIEFLGHLRLDYGEGLPRPDNEEMTRNATDTSAIVQQAHKELSP